MAASTLTHPQTSRAPVFDAELISRYDISGPRYTSYPTAPQFHDGFAEADLCRIAQASNEDPIPRALSLYVHVPFCLSPCFYCGCTRIITRDRRKADEYMQRLLREIEMTAPLFDNDRRVNQLHLGGGTPNFLVEAQMRTLLDALAKGFNFSDEAAREFGIEVDPRYANAETIRMLGEVGFNRISLGIQDFDPEVQRAVNRIQSFDETREVIEAARSCGFRSVSVDLIHGLPLQNTARFANTLEQVLALAPDRIATYSYAHMPERFRAQKQIIDSELPDAGTRLALIGQTVETLTAAGYRYIGLDHFALPEDDLSCAQRRGTLQRNFQGYSTHGDCDLIGLGMSSIGHVGRSFHQNARDLAHYYAAIDAGHLPVQKGMELSEDDLIRADLIHQLMCHGELDIAAFEHHHDILFNEYFAAEMERMRPLEADGLVSLQSRRIAVTSRGRFLLRIIAMNFDAYLGRVAATTPAYSRAL
ncbi:oxygen-independent coproporphyrinogen III oxidase [Dokdonella sp.]|uniref:oxygen-independent coproporphyrinogen III oxidase n=1 Tax=Dokdonella sp. TaxID=2291710 RepID=UPI003C582D16